MTEPQDAIAAGLDRLNEGFGIFDADLRLVASNRLFAELRDYPAALRRTGTELEHLLRHSARRGDFGSGDPEQLVAERLTNIRAHSRREVEREMPDGRILRIVYRHLADGGLCLIYEDKTAEHRAQAAVKLSEERYALVTRALSEGVYDWNVKDDQLHVSDRLNKIFDFEPGELLSKTWADRIHPDDVDGYITALRSHFQGETDRMICEYRIRDKSGAYRWVADHGIGERAANGRVHRLVGAVRDVTALKQANQEKDQLVAELNAVLDTIDYGVLFMGPDLRGRVVNRARRDAHPVGHQHAGDERPGLARPRQGPLAGPGRVHDHRLRRCRDRGPGAGRRGAGVHQQAGRFRGAQRPVAALHPGRGRGMKARILVVDDEPDVEALLTQKFRRRIRTGDLDFVFAHDGQQALEVLAEDGDIDMVLSDINMPRLDGLALLERLNDLHAELHTVIISAYGDMTNIRTAMNRGAFDFLTKPIEFDDLEVTIEKTLKHMRMLRELETRRVEAEQAKATLARYFSPTVAAELARDPSTLSSGGTRRRATFMFTDLAGFTPLAETTEPRLVVALLNEYFDNLSRIVFEHEGTVLKIIGDALHAMFGAPVEQSDHARRAVDCALAIDAFAAEFQARKQSEGLALGHTRIGINTGDAVIGTFGGEHFFDYTAHGDAINVASRLEGANKRFGTRICAAETTVDLIDDFCGRPIGLLHLKGRAEPLRAYEPLRPSPDPAPTAYRAAYAKMEASDPSAAQAFAALVGEVGDDPLASFHLRRLLTGESGIEIDLEAG